MNKQLMRFKLDSTRIYPLTDLVTRKRPNFYQNADFRIDLWAVSGNSPWDISNVTQFEVQFRDPTNPTNAPVVDMVVASGGFNFTYVTSDAFATGASNVTFNIPAASAGLFPVSYNSQEYLLFVLARLADGSQLVVQSGPVDVLWDGLVGSVVPAQPLAARFFNGAFQIYCPDNALYYDVRIRIVGGVPTLSVEGPGDP